MPNPRTHSCWSAPPRWYAYKQLRQQAGQHRPEPLLLSWLNESGSLTTRLLTLAQGQFQVCVLCEGWARPSREEQQHLHLPAREYAWIREVVLRGQGQDWVRARSILPRRSLVGVGKRLTRLGSRSLGGLLFRDPALQRGEITMAPIGSASTGNAIWARRSRLTLHGHSVLVAEAFLPALLDYQQA